MSERPVALVTGASRGIGRAIACRLAREGYDLGLVGRDLGALEDVAREVVACGGKAACTPSDLSRPGGPLAAYAAVMDQLKRIDVLVNNAGVCRVGKVLEYPEECWDETFNVNVRAMFAMCRLVLPGMLARGSGVIINMSSSAGKRGFPLHAAYCASKFAVIGFSEALAQEVGRSGIRVNCIAPGEVDTELNRASHCDLEDKSDWLKPEDIADVVALLVSDQARAVVGTTIEVYGKSYLVNVG